MKPLSEGQSDTMNGNGLLVIPYLWFKEINFLIPWCADKAMLLAIEQSEAKCEWLK